VTFGHLSKSRRKFFAPLAEEIRTLSGTPHRHILMPNGNRLRREVTHDWSAIGNGGHISE
jgi:hypothetical protein